MVCQGFDPEAVYDSYQRVLTPGSRVRYAASHAAKKRRVADYQSRRADAEQMFELARPRQGPRLTWVFRHVDTPASQHDAVCDVVDKVLETRSVYGDKAAIASLLGCGKVLTDLAVAESPPIRHMMDSHGLLPGGERHRERRRLAAMAWGMDDYAIRLLEETTDPARFEEMLEGVARAKVVEMDTPRDRHVVSGWEIWSSRVGGGFAVQVRSVVDDPILGVQRHHTLSGKTFRSLEEASDYETYCRFRLRDNSMFLTASVEDENVTHSAHSQGS
jgi:hypothetical protein